ncbi:hypothetical protein EYF80_043426 [Liparis tanakae]|uniref:Uncharacterized protein n=1 Tax=Liparis tanakae TaxID=230148 RepID=A0A4Z2FYJ2_9TELE|nr:hypothetical protein EYF80_043426 [Liparis tanakae]
MQLDSFQSHQSPWADLPGTVAALPSQVLAVGQDARGPSALERKPGVDEASRQLQLLVGEHVEEGHQVPVVLVALKVDICCAQHEKVKTWRPRVCGVWTRSFEDQRTAAWSNRLVQCAAAPVEQVP